MSNNNHTVHRIFSDEGEVKDLRTYSARLKHFLNDYPPSQGWAIKTKEKMFESQDSDYVRIRFRAYLVNPKGEKLTDRSSFGILSDYKSWQKIETNACSRLLAALGYGSEVFDEDEITDLNEQGFRVETHAQAQADTLKVVNRTEAPEQTQETQIESTDMPVSESEAPIKPVKIPRTLLTNIKRIALNLGETVPDFTSKEEATEYLQYLMSKAKSNDAVDTDDVKS